MPGLKPMNPFLTNSALSHFNYSTYYRKINNATKSKADNYSYFLQKKKFSQSNVFALLHCVTMLERQ